MKKSIKIITLSLAIVAFFAVANTSLAVLNDDVRASQREYNNAFIEQSSLGVNNPTITVAAVIKWILSFVGIIFLILIIYAGFTWMTSAGNEEKVSKAKKVMTSAIIGLAIVIGSYAITYFVIENLLNSTGAGSLESQSVPDGE